ncbi:MAG: SDR family oxidoreductase [Deltaproteobacteria bacterium]|nr:SDR family oxidoreductase [Deltaproteobacteria bacterium]MBW2418808.1 SDR family oxidoreductase [Deltaproteobacteria bacterium]
MRRFEDRVVLLTGAASGIGKATVLRMAEEGASIACADVQVEAVEATAEEARALGADAIALTCDVSSREESAATVQKTVEHFGRLDSLCNIAGILYFENTHQHSLEKWDQLIAVNLTGVFLMCRAGIPHLLESKGNIVNMSSTSALRGNPWTAAYAAAKGGVLSFTRGLAVEYGKQGLRSNSVCPGSVSTPITSAFKLPDGADVALLQRVMPLDEFRGPEYAASVIAFLASDDAAHINGAEIRCDGGALS